MIRALALAAALAVAACDATPASLGITGPGAPPPPAPAPDDSTIDMPGIVAPGGGNYGPSVGPTPSNGRYFNYN
jgi:hypothetical protein